MKNALAIVAISAAALTAGSASALTYTAGFDTSERRVELVDLMRGTLSVGLSDYDFTDDDGTGNRTSAVSLLLDGTNVTRSFAGDNDVDVAGNVFGEFLRIGDVSEGSAATVNDQRTVVPGGLLFTGLERGTRGYSLRVFDTNGDPDSFVASFVAPVAVPLPAAMPLMGAALALFGLAGRRRTRTA